MSFGLIWSMKWLTPANETILTSNMSSSLLPVGSSMKTKKHIAKPATAKEICKALKITKKE
jgi:hypothetical protein